MTDTVLIIDFGSQVTQLIARRVREQGVYSEIVPFNKAEAALARLKPKAIILSGGPASVTEDGSPRAPDGCSRPACRCWASATASRRCAQLGGEVEGGHHREFGRAEIESPATRPLFEGVWQMGERDTVWMSHGDRVTRLPAGLRGRGRVDGRAVRGHRRREAQALRRAVPSGGGAHAARRAADRQLRAQHRRPDGRLDAWRLPRRAGRQDPRPGRQGPGDLRAVRRRRQRGRRRADPRGDRRPAHLRLRRPRPAAARRGRAGRDAVPRRTYNIPLVHVDASGVPRRAGRRDRPRDQAQDHRRAVHRRVRGGGARSSAAPSSWPRARSIPT